MKTFRIAILLFSFLTVITGMVYPVIVTVISRLSFPEQAAGSLIRRGDGTVMGSALIGQPFSDSQYFWPRPSATTDFPYNSMASGGSNLGPTNPELLKTVADRVKSLQESGMAGPVPSDLVQSSGSGLDPHISPEAAIRQIPRVAKVRRLAAEKLLQLVQAHVEAEQLGFLGMPRVNVLKLNLALDRLSAHGR